MTAKKHGNVLHRFKMCDEVVVCSTGKRATICETREDKPDEYLVEYWPPYDELLGVVHASDLRPWLAPPSNPHITAAGMSSAPSMLM